MPLLHTQIPAEVWFDQTVETTFSLYGSTRPYLRTSLLVPLKYKRHLWWEASFDNSSDLFAILPDVLPVSLRCEGLINDSPIQKLIFKRCAIIAVNGAQMERSWVPAAAALVL